MPDDDGPLGPPLKSAVRRFRDHHHLVVERAPGTTVAERYRSLAVNLSQARKTDEGQIVVITSSVPEEGKTLTALNLAVAQAENQATPTLLIDADMRRPSLTQFLEPPAGLGLAEVLAGSVSLENALTRIENSNLWVLPAGQNTNKPLALLRPATLEPLFAELRRTFRQTVIDTPPVVPFSDANRLGVCADGAILVARAAHTTKPIFDRALDSLVGVRLLGAILTDTSVTPLDRYYYRYDESNPYASRGAESA